MLLEMGSNGLWKGRKNQGIEGIEALAWLSDVGNERPTTEQLLALHKGSETECLSLTSTLSCDLWHTIDRSGISLTRYPWRDTGFDFVPNDSDPA